MSFHVLTILSVSCLSAGPESMAQWYLKCTELCLLICGHFCLLMSLNNPLIFPIPSFSFHPYLLSVGGSLSIWEAPTQIQADYHSPVIDCRNSEHRWSVLENTLASRFKWGTSQGDFRGMECMLQLSSQEEQEHREKNLTSSKGVGKQKMAQCWTQKLASSVYVSQGPNYSLVTRKEARLSHNLDEFSNTFLIPSCTAFIIPSLNYIIVYFSLQLVCTLSGQDNKHSLNLGQKEGQEKGREGRRFIYCFLQHRVSLNSLSGVWIIISISFWFISPSLFPSWDKDILYRQ